MLTGKPPVGVLADEARDRGSTNVRHLTLPGVPAATVVLPIWLAAKHKGRKPPLSLLHLARRLKGARGSPVAF